jgi:ribosomal-protein-alanine N-acetyltransferase
MNAQLDLPPPRLRPLQVADLDRVLAIEVRVYSFPWTRGNFVDSLAAGYVAELLVGSDDEIIGYIVAMPGVDEMHLLNITVAPAWQRMGYASMLLDRLEQHCREQQAPLLWLEVRGSNERARHVYRRRGFVEAGLRRNYYPAAHGTREDAIVMSLAVKP